MEKLLGEMGLGDMNLSGTVPGPFLGGESLRWRHLGHRGNTCLTLFTSRATKESLLWHLQHLLTWGVLTEKGQQQ